MKHILLVAIFFFIGQFHALSQNGELPVAARRVLDQKLGKWEFQPCLGGEVPSDASPLWKCDLNADSVVDYAIHLKTGNHKKQTEYFVALVSNDTGYTLHILISYKPADQDFDSYCLIIVPKGSEVSDYSFADKDSVYADRRVTHEEERNLVVYSIDLPTIVHRQHNAATSFAYRNGRFVGFYAAD